jgi:Mg-chelatase subunit ChlD
MTRRLNYAICGALLFFGVCQSQMEGQTAPVPPAQPKVQIYLTASNRDGSPAVPMQSDLSVKIDKQPAEISSLRSLKDEPLVFTLLIDASTSEGRDAESIRNAAKSIFQSLSNGGNKGYIGVFDVALRLSNRPLQNSEAQRALDGFKFGGATALYDAIGQTCTRALSRSGNPSAPRRLIILLSDGDDNQSHLQPAKAEEVADEQGVAIFSLTTESDATKGGHFLRELANTTGGKVISSRKLEDGVTPLLNAIDNQWEVDLTIPENLDKKPHSLAIEDSQKGVRVSAPVHILLP